MKDKWTLLTAQSSSAGGSLSISQPQCPHLSERRKKNVSLGEKPPFYLCDYVWSWHPPARALPRLSLALPESPAAAVAVSPREPQPSPSPSPTATAPALAPAPQPAAPARASPGARGRLQWASAPSPSPAPQPCPARRGRTGKMNNGGKAEKENTPSEANLQEEEVLGGWVQWRGRPGTQCGRPAGRGRGPRARR